MGPVIIAVSVLVLPTSAIKASSPEVICELTDPRLTEISGMAPSQLHSGVMWVHNDSGDKGRLYALQLSNCAVVGELTLRDVSARDFEGLAAGVDARGRPVLWVGDIGDNRDSWSDVSIYRIREPKKLGKTSAQAQRYRFTYEDRPHNAETILADPNSQQLWIVTKQMASGSIYALPKKLRKSGINIARKISSSTGLITDGAIRPDGTTFVLRDYFQAQFFRGLPVGVVDEIVDLPGQPQGEAIAWLPGENAIAIASENDDRVIRIDLPEVAAAAAAEDLIESTDPTESPDPTQVVRVQDFNYASRFPVIVGVIAGVIALVTGLILMRKRPESKKTGSNKKAV